MTISGQPGWRILYNLRPKSDTKNSHVVFHFGRKCKTKCENANGNLKLIWFIKQTTLYLQPKITTKKHIDILLPNNLYLLKSIL